MTDKQPVNVAEHIPRLRRVALRILGDAHEADEAVQEACLRAVRAGDSFNGRAHVTTWLHRIVTRCALDRIRKKKRETRAGAAVDCATLSGALAFVGDGPFKLAERRELLAIMNVAVEALPDDCRDAFVLTQTDDSSGSGDTCLSLRPASQIGDRKKYGVYLSDTYSHSVSPQANIAN